MSRQQPTHAEPPPATPLPAANVGRATVGRAKPDLAAELRSAATTGLHAGRTRTPDVQRSRTPYGRGLANHPATRRPTGRPPSPVVPASVQSPATEKRTRKPDEPTGKMRVEKNVPREVYCPRCGTRMKPSSTPKSFRWFKCTTCGRTHRLWRRFEWVSIREQV